MCMIVYIFFIMIIHYLEMFIPFFILYNYKYRKSAVHHERHTALFSANRAIFNIYSSNYYLTPPAVFLSARSQ